MRNEAFASMDLFTIACIRDPYIHMMLNNLFDKHHQTCLHSLHTAMIAAAMGAAYNRLYAKSDAELLDLEALVEGAILHDVGKLVVFDDILQNELDGISLTMEQKKMLEKHPKLGHHTVEGHLNNPIILDIIKHHHERSDGSGYPDGLKSEEISIYAKIVGVADAFDFTLGQLELEGKGIDYDNTMKAFITNKKDEFDPEIVNLLENRLILLLDILNGI